MTEVNPPVKATPLQWLLITNIKANDFTDAIQRIRWYSLRWQIEVYFKVLKSGVKIEHCRLQTQDRLLRYIALMSVIAWRLYWLTMYNRHAPDAECTSVLTDDEWKAL
ncbi:transposase, partial [Candidatus Poribacteria bacterium]|nr:transposase [Candidatus Poribacteria bacterium]